MKLFTISMIATTESGDVILTNPKGQMIRIKRCTSAYSAAHYFPNGDLNLTNDDKIHACKIHEIPVKPIDKLGVIGGLAF